VPDEAARKREAALEAAGGRLVTSRPWDVRWLLCGRGRPVDVSAPDSPYTICLEEGSARVLFQDIERSRVAAEERLDELGYELAPYPWHEGHGLEQTDSVLDELRRELCPEEVERYRAVGADTADAMRETLGALTPETAEADAAAELARQAGRRGLVPVVDLVAGKQRQKAHRHPLPTNAPLGSHALLAITTEREGLHVSMTRLISFGRPPEELTRLVQACAEVDAAYIAASQPGATLGEVFAAGERAYAEQGFPEEWRGHHQGGLAGYRGREVFAAPGEPARIPSCAALAWNPSIAGGAKSEDTVLVSDGEVEVVTRTPDLGELETGVLSRPAIVEL
jgi:peptidase M24-like protein